MTESQQSSNSWLLWLSAAVVAILIVVLLLLAFIFTNGANNDDMAVEVTPISGGMPVPIDLSDSTASDDTGSEADTASESLAVGVKVTSISPNGRGTRLYSDADAGALVMDLYKDGAAFFILEPSDDYAGYPVVNGDANWYRVRTSDGLVGWVVAEQVVPIE